MIGLFGAVVGLLAAARSPLEAQDESAADGSPVGGAEAESTLDEVKLKDGSVLLGDIVGLGDGTLTISTAFGIDEKITVKWSEVASVTTGKSHQIVLSDGSAIHGRVVRTEDGSLVISGDTLGGEGTVPIAQVTAINPPPKKDVTLTGNVNFGASVTDGNTQTKTASLSANAVARSERQRLTLGAAWNYAESNAAGITARNTKGVIKYDFFVTDRFFLYAGAFFEEDSFQDLNLRTALSAGPGYQFVEAGDFEAGTWLENLSAYGEVGLAFFNEDFRSSPDNRYISARWAFRAELPLSDRLVFFHNHEGYPGLEDISDLYITTEQGVRFTVWENFLATLQVNWRWDNTPSPGFERSDTLYLMTLGYQFEL